MRRARSHDRRPDKTRARKTPTRPCRRRKACYTAPTGKLSTSKPGAQGARHGRRARAREAGALPLGADKASEESNDEICFKMNTAANDLIRRGPEGAEENVAITFAARSATFN